jgi:hypothetical protein
MRRIRNISQEGRLRAFLADGRRVGDEVRGTGTRTRPRQYLTRLIPGSVSNDSDIGARRYCAS